MQKKQIKLLILLLISSSCSIERPDTDLCGINAQKNHQLCYNLKKDYDKDGVRLPEATPIFKPAITVKDLDKNICTDAKGYENLLIYVKQLRSEYDACVKKLDSHFSK